MTTHNLPQSFREYTKHQLQKVRHPKGFYSKKISWFEKNIDWLLDNGLVTVYQQRGYIRIDVTNICSLFISDYSSHEACNIIQKLVLDDHV